MTGAQLPVKIGDGVSQRAQCDVQWLFLLQLMSSHPANAEAGTVVTVVAAERATVSIAMIHIILFMVSLPFLAVLRLVVSQSPPSAAFTGARFTAATIVRTEVVVKSLSAK